MNKDVPDCILLNCIERMKRKMIESAKYTGLQSEETIKCSEKVDILINREMRYSKNQDIHALINAS